MKRPISIVIYLIAVALVACAELNVAIQISVDLLVIAFFLGIFSSYLDIKLNRSWTLTVCTLAVFFLVLVQIVSIKREQKIMDNQSQNLAQSKLQQEVISFAAAQKKSK